MRSPVAETQKWSAGIGATLESEDDKDVCRLEDVGPLALFYQTLGSS